MHSNRISKHTTLIFLNAFIGCNPGPWMTTYVTPLYAENITRDCGKVDRVFLEISGGRCCCGLLRHLFSEENRLKVLSPF